MGINKRSIEKNNAEQSPGNALMLTGDQKVAKCSISEPLSCEFAKNLVHKHFPFILNSRVGCAILNIMRRSAANSQNHRDFSSSSLQRIFAFYLLFFR